MPNDNGDTVGRPQDVGGTYRGGFSSSVVDGMFEDHGHSDCCVLTCCGILLYDRNVYLLTGKRPSWKGRCGIVTCFCLVLVVGILAMMVAAYLYNYELEHIKELESKGRKTNQDDISRMDTVKKLTNLAHICRVLVWVTAFYLLLKAAQYRYRARRFLMAKLYEQRASSEDNQTELENATAETPLVPLTASEELKNYLQDEKRNICCATAPLGCVPKDAIVDPSSTAAPIQNNDSTDLCHFLFKILSCLCCGGCCNCWCQCLGLCAIAQEDHELQRILPKAKFEVDYITFQPFAEYFPKLEALRQDKVNNLLTHVSTLSELSTHLCRALGVALAFLTLVAFSGYDPLFQPAHLLVVCMTFFQGFIIISLVHWMWNRFDLSFDAVVKYFASGFILCTANAFVYETFVSTSIGLGMNIIRAILTPPSDDATDTDASDDGTTNVGQHAPVWLLAIATFLNAFAVAAMVEEISKYFGYWMVEHPDLALPKERSSEGDRNNEAASGDVDVAAPPEPRTMKSLGAGITVAMVAAAVGFATCENFLYVFVYSRTAEATNQMVTLLARSIFPVHPLAAAIQSIGVCQRDVEKDSSMKFGRILFPALLLHGFFDFALMFMAAMQSPGDAEGQDGKARLTDEPGSPLDDRNGSAFDSALPSIISSCTIVLLAAVYYVVNALAQRKRLDEMDKRRSGNGEYAPLLS